MYIVLKTISTYVCILPLGIKGQCEFVQKEYKKPKQFDQFDLFLQKKKICNLKIFKTTKVKELLLR